MMARRPIAPLVLRATPLLFGMLCLGGCADDAFPDYNYKMTIYAGGKTFSSVRAVKQERVSSAIDSSGQSVKRSVEGEAVIIELNGRAYYALLASSEEPEYAQKVAGYALLPLIPEYQRNPKTDTLAVERGTESLDRMADAQQQMVKIDGPVQLPRTRPNPDPIRGMRGINAWPAFVTFDDPNDPTTVRPVSPDSIGVSNISIEISDEVVTAGIEKRLTWWTAMTDKHFDGSYSGSFDPSNPDFRSRLVRAYFAVRAE